jgi:hypothetical protein
LCAVAARGWAVRDDGGTSLYASGTMLNQILHWILISATVADIALLSRLITLKLHRVYVFIALDCALGVLFDAVTLWYGWDSQAAIAAFQYSRLLYAAVIPMIAWDVFEELLKRYPPARQIAATHLRANLLSGIVFAVLLLISAGFSDTDGETFLTFIGMALWAFAAVLSLNFIWRTVASLRAKNIELPRNTQVWSLFYKLNFGWTTLLVAMLFFGFPSTNEQSDVVAIISTVFGIAVTAWCVLRLQRSIGAPQTAPANSSDL